MREIPVGKEINFDGENIIFPFSKPKRNAEDLLCWKVEWYSRQVMIRVYEKSLIDLSLSGRKGIDCVK